MALSGRIKSLFQQQHGLSLEDASSTLFASSEGAPLLGERTPKDTIEISGRGHVHLQSAVDVAEKDRANQNIIRGW
ncbi:MAG: hypothetical protein AAF086_08195 [Planctomycetota bacterium]